MSPASFDDTVCGADEIVACSRSALKAALRDASHVDLSHLGAAFPNSGWPLALDTASLLHSLVRCFGPRHICELGSGLSTLLLSDACESLEHVCAITSIDNDPDVLRTVRETLASRQYRCEVTFQLAPLVLRRFGGRLLSAYHFAAGRLSVSLPVDLALIDGPSDKLGGREGTFYQLFPLLRPGSIVLLDDAQRDSEASALLRWRDAFGDAIDVDLLPGFTKGLACIIVKRTDVNVPVTTLATDEGGGSAALGREAPQQRQLIRVRSRLLRSLARERRQRTAATELRGKNATLRARIRDLRSVATELRSKNATLRARLRGLCVEAKNNEATFRMASLLSSLAPPGSRVYVVGKGDDRLLLGCTHCERGHFPCDLEGRYTGYHPADSSAAIDNLEWLRRNGDLLLIFPEASLWWLEHYAGFSAYLSDTCECLVADPVVHMYRVPECTS